tara:strand:+ start:93 stop:1754 length:1662 start_codon:yes stop_codon:yes gene_type:complete
MNNNDITIGLILESKTINKYIKDFIEWASTEEGINVAYYLIQGNDFSSEKGEETRLKRVISKGLSKTFQNRIKRWIINFEQKRNINNSQYHKDHRVTSNIDEYEIHKLEYEAIYSETGVSVRFSEKSLDEIKNLNIDLLLRFNKRIIRGEALTLAKHGILSIHLGSDVTNRGGPSGFWEVYNEEASSSFIIQQLTEDLDNGNIVFRGSIPTQKSWSLNRAELNLRATSYLKMIIIYLLKNQELPDFKDSMPFTTKLNTNPTNKEMLTYFIKRFKNRKIDKKYNNADNTYGVGFQKTQWGKMEYRKAHFIENPPNHFLADPFVYRFKGEDYCFVEAFNYLEKKAQIDVYKLIEDKYEYLGIALKEDFHLSFPYIFEFKENVYMIPESAKNKDIRLYKAVNFPFDWELEEVLIDNIDAADSLVFHHNKKWWLFTNVDPLMKGDHNFQLDIYYSDSLLKGDWIPHKQNPVILEPTFARNGGILFSEDNIYRVGQKFGFYKKYGLGFSIRKILHLDEESYIESEEVSYEDYYSSEIIGSHHIHSNSIYTVFDIWKKA